MTAGAGERVSDADLYTKVETTGVETVNNQPCYRVVMTPPKGKPETRYFDQKTGLAAPRGLVLIPARAPGQQLKQITEHGLSSGPMTGQSGRGW